ncbi:FecR family protein [Marinibactrum halimedae]|uniref:DUF4974 domain-containing protein n=1 Tax=Marinibactrum halimedae TaxID=1444977 RepID=A0AA37WNK0_9GAMM|nr:FecR domain-containing protein [Marinibactrum halimedae]MCD9458841.1 FecR domain-containing protein [Marinibactrum halimedae]GLS27693.1 hypothetical protein GCM10007877_34120 [Marinibactrum halimedae]
MTKVYRLSNKERQAAQWCIELQSQLDMSEDRQVEFIQWLREDPIHETLLNKSEACLAELSCLDADNLNKIVGDSFVDSSTLYKNATSHRNTTSYRNEWTSTRKSKPFFKYASIAASFLMIAILTTLSFNFVTNKTINQHYQTSTGEQKTFLLEDESVITLNTRSEIHVQYTAQERRIIMVSGEVFYEVAHDPERSFIVDTGVGEVTALGTKFNIRQYNGNTIVTLLDGLVEVETDLPVEANSRSGVKQLHPGEQLLFSQNGITAKTEVPNATDIVGWKNGSLNFSDAKLIDVINEVNRYTTRRLVIEENGIADEHISAYFDVKNVDALLFALNEVYGIKHYSKSGRVYLYKPKAFD